MSPFTFIASYRVEPGRLDHLQTLAQEYAAQVEEEESCVSLGLYFNEDGTRFSHVIVLRDTDAMDLHLTNAHPLIARAAELVNPETLSVFGTPGPVLQAALEANDARGARITVMERPGPGFTHGLR